MTEEQTQQNNYNNNNNISVCIEGDKSGFNSKTAIERFKSSVKSNLNFNLEEFTKKYVKPEYHLELVDKTSSQIKFIIDRVESINTTTNTLTTNNNSNNSTNNLPKVTESTNNSDEVKNKHSELKAKLKMMRNNRTNSDYHKAKSNKNVTDEILNEYIKLKKISKVPIPEPAEILDHPEEYTPVISSVLQNSMMKQLGSAHPYVRYFKLLAEKLGIDTNPLPMPTQDFTNPTSKTSLPSNINNIMNMAGPIHNPITNIKGNNINNINSNQDTDSEED